jgi:hypothetical protein
MNPPHEMEIATEIAAVSKQLNVSITLAHEGMQVRV